MKSVDEAAKKTVPSVALMQFAFVLTGLGTAMLGPLLPLLTKQWHLLDEQSGLLLFSQFCGSFLGGATMSWRLKRGLLFGVTASTAGLLVFAFSSGLSVACPALFVTGFGLGHSITAVNVLAGQRYTEKRAAALSLLNFFWSFGAMLAPLLSGWLAPHVSLHLLLLSLALLFAACSLGLLFEMRDGFHDVRATNSETSPGLHFGISAKTFIFFMSMLFLYGGLETALSGWLTTYAFRYGEKTLAVSQYTTLLLWMSLTVGRIGSAALLRRLGETLLWRVALVATVLLTGLLALAHTTGGIALVTVLLALSLSPWFPVTFSLLMGHQPRARQAGIVIAVSGLGAASLPWIMGILSTHTGSLHKALIIPFLAAVLLLGMSLVDQSRAQRTTR